MRFSQNLTRKTVSNINLRSKARWRKARRISFCFLLLFPACLLFTALWLIVKSKHCPDKPKLKVNFWENSTFYYIDPFAFKDSDKDGIGDIQGIIEKVKYLNLLNVKTVVLGPLFKGEFDRDYFHMTSDFTQMDSSLGSFEDLKLLIEALLQNNIHTILTIDINSVSVKHDWLKDKPHFFLKPPPNLDWEARNGHPVVCTYGSTTYYTSMGRLGKNNDCLQVDLNLTNPEVVSKVHDLAIHWLNYTKMSGLHFTNVAFYCENFDKVLNKKGYEKYKEGQIFTKETITLLQNIRQNIFEKLNLDFKVDKLFMVSAGDIEYGSDFNAYDPLTEEILNPERELAHLVVVSELFYRRGWKDPSGETGSKTKLNLTNCILLYNEPEIVLALNSPYHRRHFDMMAMIMALTLRSVPMLYMGTELYWSTFSNVTISQIKDSPIKLPFYPKGVRSLAFLHKTGSVYNDDIFGQALMPWSESYTQDTSYAKLMYSGLTTTVEDAVTSFDKNMNDNLIRIISVLSGLQGSPSFANGTFSHLCLNPEDNTNYCYIYTRSSEDSAKYVIILKMKTNSTIDLRTDDCVEAKVILTIPTSGLEDTMLTMSVIPIKENLIMILECARMEKM